MPGMYAEGEYDIAGFTVGVVNRSQMLSGERVTPGDVILGLTSSGVHSNGYSLVRKLVEDAGLGWSDRLPGDELTVADRLLTPTRIYVQPILRLLASGLPVHAMAHITGEGSMKIFRAYFLKGQRRSSTDKPGRKRPCSRGSWHKAAWPLRKRRACGTWALGTWS